MPTGVPFVLKCPRCAVGRRYPDVEATRETRVRSRQTGRRRGSVTKTETKVRCKHCDHVWWTRLSVGWAGSRGSR
jgi:phage FluMu protein Com